MTSGGGFSPLAENQSPFQVFAEHAIRVFRVVQAWNDRSRQRHDLRRLDDRLLADIGVSRAASAREAEKLPWEV
jgi:uncharacterized protein YjiS (DUF1127 family)